MTATGSVAPPISEPVCRWHLFLCADQTKALCCDKAVGLAAWDYLKSRIKELGLERGEVNVQRTKANCLRTCQDGPILLVYPGGYWYRQATPAVIERVLQEHILEGRPVSEYLFALKPLADGVTSEPVEPESPVH